MTTSAQPQSDKDHLIYHFAKACQEALKVQCSIECSFENSHIYNKDDFAESVDLAANLGIVSNVVMGSLSIAFPQDCFLSIISNWLGEQYTEINDENADAGSELLNIIFGMVKAELSAQNFKMAIPVVVRGKDISIKFDPREPTHVIEFKCNHGNFYMACSVTLNQ